MLKLGTFNRENLITKLILNDEKENYKVRVFRRIKDLNKYHEKNDTEASKIIGKDILRDFGEILKSYFEDIGFEYDDDDDFTILVGDKKEITYFCRGKQLLPKDEDRTGILNGYRPELKFILDDNSIKVHSYLIEDGDFEITHITNLVITEYPKDPNGISFPIIRPSDEIRGHTEYDRVLKVGSMNQVPRFIKDAEAMLEYAGIEKIVGLKEISAEIKSLENNLSERPSELLLVNNRNKDTIKYLKDQYNSEMLNILGKEARH